MTLLPALRQLLPSFLETLFFTSITSLLVDNPFQRNYGVSITDIDKDGKFEFVVAGFGYRNLAYKWNAEAGAYDQIADSVLQDASRKAIGLAACDIDGDGYEELYVLNTDQYSGDTTTLDGLFDMKDDGSFVDLFTEERNLASGNYVAGRSAACVDRFGKGNYGVMVANYGAEMKLFEINDNNVLFDAAPGANMALSAGGRALVTGPIVSDRNDVFANNEIDYSGTGRRRLSHRDNFMFVHNQDDSGTYTNKAATLGIDDPNNTGRGTALLDANGDGLIDIVYGNWNSQHRLYIQQRYGDSVSFTDQATPEMQVASPIRTVIVADFDNDGYEEIFWNNIPGENRLFRKLPTDSDWVRVNVGDALEMDGYGTGGAVGDFDEDGMLELIVAHGESGPLQQLSLYRASSGQNNHYLRILPLTEQGAPARGSRVDMTAGGRTQVRIIDSGSGYLCQMEPVAHFGLGQLLVADSVRITWTDGTTCDFKPGQIDRVIRVQKNSSMCSGDNGVVFEAATTQAPTGNPFPLSKSPSTAPSDRPIVCGDNRCEEGEFMSCPSDCVQEITEAVCDCAIANGLCGETCPAVLNLNEQCSTYGINGICGGIIDSNAVYRDICSGCPSDSPSTSPQMPTYQPTYADCLALEGTQDQIQCLQDKIEVLSGRCQSTQEYQNSCASVRDDISSILGN